MTACFCTSTFICWKWFRTANVLSTCLHPLNLKKIFYSQFHWKNISKFFQKIRKSFFCKKNKNLTVKKHFEIFSENPKKFFCKKKKKDVTWGKCTYFPSKIRRDLSLGFDLMLSKNFVVHVTSSTAAGLLRFSCRKKSWFTFLNFF